MTISVALKVLHMFFLGEILVILNSVVIFFTYKSHDLGPVVNASEQTSVKYSQAKIIIYVYICVCPQYQL